MESTHEITPEALLAHSDWIRRLVTGLVLDPGRAEDVLQETWLAALQSPPREDLDLRAWLATVARNAIRSLGRGEGRRRRREEVAARVEGLPDTVDVIAKARLQGRMVEAVLELDEPYRTTVLLRFFEELPPREIARRLGRPVNTVHSHIARGLERLRGELDREYGDRETWGMAFLPLLHGGGSSAVHGSTLLKTGGWIMLLKWTLPVAAALAALFYWGENGEVQTQLRDESDPRAPIAIVEEDVVPSEPREVAQPETSAREELSEEQPAVAASAAPREQHLYQGRVVDLEGRPLRDFGLLVQDPTRPRLRDGWLEAERSSVELHEELRELMAEHPEAIEQVLPGVKDPQRVAELLAGRELEPERIVTDDTGAFSAELPFAGGEFSCVDSRFDVLGHGEARPIGGAVERVYVVTPVEPLAGRVVNQAGEALVGVRLSSGIGLDGIPGFPLNLDSTAGYRNWSTVSDESGGFRFESFPLLPGMRLATDFEGYKGEWHVIERSDRPYLELVLEEEGLLPRVTGTVLDLGGLPVDDATVAFGQYQTRTDAQGAFAMEVEFLPREDPLVALRPGARPAMIEGLGARMKQDSTAGHDLVLRLGSPTSSIAGRVVNDEGRPLAGIDVYLLGAQAFGTTSNYVEGMLDGKGWSDRAMSDAEGRFEIGGLFLETYVVAACDAATFLATRAEAVAPGTDDLELVLDATTRLPRLRGQVLDRHGRGVGDAVLSATFTTHSPRGGQSRSWKTLELGRSDGEGRFDLRGVPTEAVQFKVSGTGIEGLEVELDEWDGDDLELVVSLELRFQLDLGVATDADKFEVFDEAGERLDFWARSPGVNMWSSRYRISDREALPTFEVTDRASELVFYAAGVEVRRIALDLRRGEIVQLR